MKNENQTSLHQTNQKLAPKIEVHSDSHQEEVLNFDNPDYKFIAEDCEWRQRGPYLVCVSCEVEHAIFIGMDKRLIGFKDGKPIVKKI